MRPDREGTCLKEAGNLRVGMTMERGRHAPTQECKQTQEKKFVRAIDGDWRKKPDVPQAELQPWLEVAEGPSGDGWSEQEFGGAPLGDKRRSTRLVKSAAMLGASMGRLPRAAPKHGPAAVSEYYRFLEKAYQFEITPAEMLRRIVSVRFS